MYLTADSQLTQSELHYGSWVYPNIGAPIQLMFMGVPPCRSTNRTQPGGGEYYDGLLSSKYKNLRGNRLGHPGNLDAGVGGSGQIVIGGVDKIEPIKFCHPRNTTQPINNEKREPYISRESISRPTASVPRTNRQLPPSCQAGGNRSASRY